MSPRRAVMLSLVVALVATVIPATTAQVVEASDIVTYDTGFRPARDGFGFANWAGLNSADALSWRHMVQLLHDAGNCTPSLLETYCDLRSGYRVTLDHLNEHLSAGRCEGMVVLAARLFKRSTKLVHVSRTARTTHDLTRTESADEIAYWWGTQLAPNLQLYSLSKRALRPDDLATEITRRMHNKVMVSIGIYSGDISHTVLPFRARVVTGRTYFTVYDPNFPGETRVLTVNRYNNTWSYGRALHPDGTISDLFGKGTGGLDYVPISMRAHLGQWERLGEF